MERKYLLYSEQSCLGWFDSLEKAKSACFKDFDNKRITYYTIYVFRDGKHTKTHFSLIHFFHPTPDTRFPEFILDFGQRNGHYVLFQKK